MVKNVNDIVQLVRRRDNVSAFEAQHIVNDCIKSVREAIEHGLSLEELEDIVGYELGLEPDYLEIILHQLS